MNNREAIQLLEEKYASHALIAGLTPLYSKTVAVLILKECQNAGIGILGYDGFKIGETTTGEKTKNSLRKNILRQTALPLKLRNWL